MFQQSGKDAPKVKGCSFVPSEEHRSLPAKSCWSGLNSSVQLVNARTGIVYRTRRKNLTTQSIRQITARNTSSLLERVELMSGISHPLSSSNAAMQAIIAKLEPIWRSQVLADVSASFVEAVRKLVPEATKSQIKKVLLSFSPPDVQLSAAALRNYLNLPPLDGSPVRIEQNVKHGSFHPPRFRSLAALWNGKNAAYRVKT